MMIVNYIAPREAFVASKARLWTATKDLEPYFDLAPDGKRFVVMHAEEEQNAGEQVMLLQNFHDELQRRAPARGICRGLRARRESDL